MKFLLGIFDKETSRDTGGTPLMDWLPNRGWGGRAEVSIMPHKASLVLDVRAHSYCQNCLTRPVSL